MSVAIKQLAISNKLWEFIQFYSKNDLDQIFNLYILALIHVEIILFQTLLLFY